MFNRVGFAIAILVTAISTAAAQDVAHFDASVAWAAAFSKTSTSYSGGVVLKPTTSGAVLGTFRYHFNRMHGLEVNIARTANSQKYFIGPDNFRVNSDVAEYSGAYVFSPFRTAKLEPFLLGGAGALRFNPGNTYIDGFQAAFGAAKQTSLAFLYGRPSTLAGVVTAPAISRLHLQGAEFSCADAGNGSKGPHGRAFRRYRVQILIRN